MVKIILAKSTHVLVVAGVFLFLIRNLLNKRLAVSDFSPFYGDFGNAMSNSLFVWGGDSFGHHIIPGYLHIIRAVFEIFNNPLFAQNFFLLIMFLIGYYGLRRVMIYCQHHIYIRNVLPLFYIFNPAFATELTNGYTGAFIIYALLPWIFYFVVRLMNDYVLWRGVVLSILIGIVLLNIQIAFWVLIWIVIYVLVYVMMSLQLSVFRSIFFLMIHFLLAVFLNIPSMLNLFNYADNFGVASYLSTFRYTYADATFINIFQLLGNHGSSQYNLGYYTAPGLICGIGLFLVVVYGIFKNTYSRQNNTQHIKVFNYSAIPLTIIFSLMYSKEVFSLKDGRKYVVPFINFINLYVYSYFYLRGFFTKRQVI